MTILIPSYLTILGTCWRLREREDRIQTRQFPGVSDSEGTSSVCLCVFISTETLPFPHAPRMRLFSPPVGPAELFFTVAKQYQSCFTPSELMAMLWVIWIRFIITRTEEGGERCVHKQHA